MSNGSGSNGYTEYPFGKEWSDFGTRHIAEPLLGNLTSRHSFGGSHYCTKFVVMISGIHVIIYSKNVEKDKAFFRDVLGLPNVDVGNGWLIFGLPAPELAVHPSEESQHQEVYLMCEDINRFVEQMKQQQIACSEVQDKGWGLLVQLTLPGGGQLGVYQPRHARPPRMEG